MYTTKVYIECECDRAHMCTFECWSKDHTHHSLWHRVFLPPTTHLNHDDCALPPRRPQVTPLPITTPAAHEPRQPPAKETRQPHKHDDHTATSPTSTTTPVPAMLPACRVTRPTDTGCKHTLLKMRILAFLHINPIIHLIKLQWSQGSMDKPSPVD